MKTYYTASNYNNDKIFSTKEEAINYIIDRQFITSDLLEDEKFMNDIIIGYAEECVVEHIVEE
jgi:hypothetical protein